tara:strand:+ start:336 stop:815 length:480 start_codon:yes stop_codon:yes gene_type:complete
MNISDIDSLKNMPKRSIEQICNKLNSIKMKKRKKNLIQTELPEYYKKINNYKNNNLHKNKIYNNNKHNNMSSEKKYLLNIELENNSKINGTFIINSKKNDEYEFIPVTDIEIKDNSEYTKIYKCIYNKKKDIMTVQCGIKVIKQKIKDCRGFNLKKIDL